MPKITILPHAEICPEGAVVEAEPSKSVCENLLDNNILVEHACEMSCACTTCHVIVTEGFDTLEESSDDEEDMLDKAWGLEQRSRLSCQLRNLSNDISIQFPRYTINMVSELHPNKHNLDAEDKKSLSKDDFSVSSSAVNHLVEMMKSKPGSNGIRISLKDSGCSGYAYNLDYVKDEDPNDYHGNFSGVDVYIKDTSLIFLKGTELDFIQEGVNHNLVFKNPNVENECGCGESFTFSNKPYAELK